MVARYRLVVMLIITLAAHLLVATNTYASEEKIIAYETIVKDEGGPDIAPKTVITVYSLDGTTIRRTLIDGIFARLSPDDRHVVYGEGQRLALTDFQGKRIEYLPYSKGLTDEEEFYPMKWTWSPDSKRLAVIAVAPLDMSSPESGARLALSVVDIKTNKVSHIFKGQTDSSLLAPQHNISWFSDGRRVLFSYYDEVVIIDLKSGKRDIVSDEVAFAFLSGNEEKIVFMPFDIEKLSGESSDQEGLSFWLYDVDSGNKKNVLEADPPLVIAALSYDGSRLAMRSEIPMWSDSFHLIDLEEGTISEVEAKNVFFIPMAFSPDNNSEVFGLSYVDSWKRHGIINIESKEFRPCKDNANGHPDWILSGGAAAEWR